MASKSYTNKCNGRPNIFAQNMLFNKTLIFIIRCNSEYDHSKILKNFIMSILSFQRNDATTLGMSSGIHLTSFRSINELLLDPCFGYFIYRYETVNIYVRHVK